eukprot:NODE_9385_length_228_cov_31.234637_g8770_i0.p1 GENE.NODE_9385_length_228_cov_31.234637_g8770_i0~~NODE_9385_length_228_cov_31.234637_g8770_i0.p1  ORF type:complete len:54 (-),score=9.06 NODE_9385_length_228_cov_31.234637_g8770_i0:35-196(-)
MGDQGMDSLAPSADTPLPPLPTSVAKPSRRTPSQWFRDVMKDKPGEKKKCVIS